MGTTTKRFIQFCSAILFVCVLISCEEDPERTSISGLVLSEESDTPIANALVEYVWIEPSTPRAKYHVIDSVRTDSLGRFRFYGTTTETNLMVYVTDAERYFPTIDPYDEHGNVENGEPNVVNLHLTPHAYVDIYFEQTQSNRSISCTIEGSEDYPIPVNLVPNSNNIIRILGNGNRTILAKYIGGNYRDVSITITTGIHDTTDVFMSH